MSSSTSKPRANEGKIALIIVAGIGLAFCLAGAFNGGSLVYSLFPAAVIAYGFITLRK